MPSRFVALAAAVLFCLCTPIHALDTTRTIFRFELSGPGIGVGAEQIEVELFVRGGASLGPAERDRALRESIREIFDNEDYRTDPIEIRQNLDILDVTSSILVFGHIVDVTDRNTPIAHIPVRLIQVEPGEAVDVNLRTVPDMRGFFQQSHPFRLQADPGLMNDDNAREILYALRVILEYFLSENVPLAEEEWLRFNSFLSSNQDFLINGQEELVTDVLNYLSSSSALSQSHVFLRHYGLFLKDILSLDPDRSLGGASLGTRVIDDLRRLYQTRFKSAYFSADNVLEELSQQGRTDACLDLATVALAQLNSGFFEDVARYDAHVQFLLINALNCAIEDYVADHDGSFPSHDGLADHLASNAQNRLFMVEFVRVVETLQTEFNALRNRNERNLINYGGAFSARIGA